MSTLQDEFHTGDYLHEVCTDSDEIDLPDDISSTVVTAEELRVKQAIQKSKHDEKERRRVRDALFKLQKVI